MESRRLPVLLLVMIAAGCGARTGLGEHDSSLATAPDAGPTPPRPDAGPFERRDAGGDAGRFEDAGPDSETTWHVGPPVELEEPADGPISVARSTDSVLVAFAVRERSERHVVALALDGVARGPSAIVLEPAPGDHELDSPYGPWVTAGPSGGIVVATDEIAGCRTVAVDARGRPTGPSVSAGLRACGLVAPSAGGWSVITGLTAAAGPGDPIGMARLNATGAFDTAPVNLMEDPEDDAIVNPDRADFPDGGFALSWWGGLGPSGPAYVRLYSASGAARGPPSLMTRIGSPPGASSTRVLAVGTRALAAWTVNSSRRPPSAELQLLDESGVPSAPAHAIGVGDGLVQRVGMRALRGQVLLAWTERVSTGDVRLRIQSRAVDGSALGEPIDAVRMTAIGRPDIVETPDGALLVYVGQDGADTTAQRLYALPLSYRR